MRICAAIVGLALTACTTVSGNADVEGKVESWLGANANSIQQIWGKPTQEVGIDKDTKILQFSTQSAENPCTVVLTLNAKGEVIGTKWNGNQLSCAQFVKASPSYNDSVAKETNMAILEAIDNIKSF